MIILNIIIWLIAFTVGVGVIISLFIIIKSHIESKRYDAEHKPVKRKTYDYFYLTDIENAEKFFNYYKDEFEENDDYNETKKYLLENYYEGDRVYKYLPFELECSIDGDIVYSELDDKLYKVGRIKRQDVPKITQNAILVLYPNVFKAIREDEIEKASQDAYFGLKVES